MPTKNTTKERLQEYVFRLKTTPAVHSSVHALRRRRGQWDIVRLPEGRTRAEIEVQTALRSALFDKAPRDGKLAEIEGVRAAYLKNDKKLFDGPYKTALLSGAASSSREPRDAWLLYQLVLALRPNHAFETGTCVGISAAWQAAALPDDGRLTTFEFIPQLAEQARQTLEKVGLDDRVTIVVGDTADTFADELTRVPQLDYAFVDGNHTLEVIQRETERLLARAHEGTVIVYDDINWSSEMRQAWQELCANPRFSTLYDLRALGIAIVGPSDLPRRIHRVHYA